MDFFKTSRKNKTGFGMFVDSGGTPPGSIVYAADSSPKYGNCHCIPSRKNALMFMFSRTTSILSSPTPLPKCMRHVPVYVPPVRIHASVEHATRMMPLLKILLTCGWRTKFLGVVGVPRSAAWAPSAPTSRSGG